MPSVFLSFFAFTAVFLGIFYQIYISPFLELAGVFRNVEPLNTERCETVEDLQACEKLVIHSSGLVYLACASSLRSRLDWVPALDVFNATALQTRTSKDYIATYDPQSRAVTKLDILGFSDPRGLNVHGMDVVPDEKNPDTLWVYAVNHRPPIDLTVDAARVGADSVIEIFKTRLGQSTMEWMKTVSNPTIITPNDVVGSANGQEFWFTNDNHAKTGLMRKVYALLRVKKSSVGYCHVEDGCKIAADNLYGSNGIVRAGDGTIWVASTGGGYITVLEQQSDKSLTPTEVINIERPIDNLALSPDGSIIAATSPKVIHFISKGTKDPSVYSPLSAHRISVNTGRDSYFGVKYRVEKIFEEDGSMMGSLATSAAVYQDSLYLHGVLASRLLVCRLPSRTLNQE